MRLILRQIVLCHQATRLCHILRYTGRHGAVAKGAQPCCLDMRQGVRQIRLTQVRAGRDGAVWSRKNLCCRGEAAQEIIIPR